MRSFLSFVGSIAATTAGLFTLQSFGFRPELSAEILLWSGAVFGFINWMVIEGWNAFKPSLTAITVIKSALAMGIAFSLLSLLTFFSNQAPVGVDPATTILTLGANMFALTLFSGVGFWFGGFVGNSFGAKND